MIARIWKGWTTRDNAPAYEELFKNIVLPKNHAGSERLYQLQLAPTRIWR